MARCTALVMVVFATPILSNWCGNVGNVFLAMAFSTTTRMFAKTGSGQTQES